MAKGILFNILSVVGLQWLAVTNPSVLEDIKPKPTCDNPIMNLIRKKNMRTMYDAYIKKEPTFLKDGNDLKYCKNEWKFGSCCDASIFDKGTDDLVKRSGEITGKFAQEARKFREELKKTLQSMILTVQNTRVRLEKIGKIELEKNYKIINMVDIAKEFMIEIRRTAQFFKKERFEKSKERFEKEAPACLKALIDFKTQSICKMCSAASYLYFQNGKAVIDENQCTDIVKTCAGTWSFIYQFMYSARGYSAILKVDRLLDNHKTLHSKLDVAWKIKNPPSPTSKVIISKLIGLADLSKEESFSYTPDVGYICDKLLVVLGNNEDAMGSPTILDETIYEEMKRIREEKKMSKEDIAKMKADNAKLLQAQAEKEKKECAEKKILLNTFENKLTEFEEKIAVFAKDLLKRKATIFAIRKEKDNQKNFVKGLPFKTRLERKIQEMAKESGEIHHPRRQLQTELTKILDKCLTRPKDTEALKKKIFTHLNKIDASLKKADITKATMLSQFHSKFEEFFKKYKVEMKEFIANFDNVKSLYTKVSNMEKKKPQARMLAEEDLTELKKALKTKVNKLNEEYKKMKDSGLSFLKVYKKQIPRKLKKQIIRPFKKIVRDGKVEELRKWVKEVNGVKTTGNTVKKAGSGRVLETVNQVADGGVIVKNNPKNSLKPLEEDKTPKVEAKKINVSLNQAPTFKAIVGYLMISLTIFLVR